MRLETTERRIMETRGSRHTLMIRKVLSSDFGNYSCEASNPMGKHRAYLELSGERDIEFKIVFHMYCDITSLVQVNVSNTITLESSWVTRARI